jgi:nucleoside-diphosphate-sugar epimerase
LELGHTDMGSQPIVLVTGAQGFVGRAVVQGLLNNGQRVRVLTRPKSKVSNDLEGQVEIRKGDLTSPDTLAGLVENVDTVYHLAGEIHDSSRFDVVNRQGTVHLLAECKAGGVRRFLYLSSVGVIGARSEDAVLDETSPVSPGNLYEISKFAGEQAALFAHDPRGMQVMVLRPSIVYGEGRLPANDSFLNWMRAIKAGRFLQLGDAYISSYVYVGDVAAASLAIMNDHRSGGGVHIINEPIPLSTFVAEAASVLKTSTPRILPTPVGLLVEKALRKTGRFASLYNRTVYRMDKLTDLGFTLPFGYRHGISRTIEWYKEKGLLA